jgi:hypothetical protein
LNINKKRTTEILCCSRYQYKSEFRKRLYPYEFTTDKCFLLPVKKIKLLDVTKFDLFQRNSMNLAA